MTVLLPWPTSELSAAPDGLSVDVWDGDGEPPAVVEEVTLYVPAYTFAAAVSEVVSRMPRLEVIQVQTAGVDHILPHVPDGVTLCNARGVHDASTAELAVGLAVAAQRDFPVFVRAQDEGRWDKHDRPSLADRTVMILGYGSIGEALERRLDGFEVELIRVASRARDGVHSVDQLPELLPRTDVVIVVVPLTEATRGLVDADFLARLPDGALVVNVARGPVIDTAALLAELQSGRLRAALDVTDPEPLPPEHPLWQAAGAFITPHVGGATSAMRPRIRALVADQLRRYAAGEPMRNVVVEGKR